MGGISCNIGLQENVAVWLRDEAESSQDRPCRDAGLSPGQPPNTPVPAFEPGFEIIAPVQEIVETFRKSTGP